MNLSSDASPLRALIFDVDGTLADTEHTHLAAFNQAFGEAGLDWHWSVSYYTRLLEVAGGKERIAHHWAQVRGGTGGADAAAECVRHVHALKTTAYEQLLQQGRVPLRPGVLPLLGTARAAGLRLAIATTTSRENIPALLRPALGESWLETFDVIEDAATAPRKKPDPQVYLQALARLQLPATECLALEDSCNGLAAARGAGLAVVITCNDFTRQHDFTGALRVLPDLQGVTVADLQAWHASALH